MSQRNDHVIVGRSEPMRRFGASVSASAQGHRSVVMVSGEAGMGKTSLIRAALDAAPQDTLVVGWGTSWHGDGAPGFWPWTQALGDLVRMVGSDVASAAAGQDRDILSTVITELGSPSITDSDPVHHRLSLLDAAVSWLEALALEHHVVIVLDDLQWADSSTVDLLDHVIAGSASARLLVVGAYRHDELDGRVHSRLAGLGARSEHIHLEGISSKAVEELVTRITGSGTSDAQATELHRRSAGHPLFVTELARLSEHDAGGVLPPVITEAVARRLKSLEEEGRQMLEVASVLGNRLLPDVLGAVLGESPLDVLRLLESARAAGFVRGSSSEEFWFTHDLFRETLYGQLDPVGRSQLHGRVGEALEARVQRGGSVAPGDLAYHFAEAVGTGDPLIAFHWARKASDDERRRSAFTEAAEHLSRVRAAALDAGRSIEPEMLVRLLIEEADSRARSGEPDAARQLLLRAASVAPDPRLMADVALAVQRLGAKFAARRDEIIAHLEFALDAVTGIDLGRQAQVTAALARELQHSVAEDRQRAGALSEEALNLGREADDDETLIACLLARHDALWTPGTGIRRSELGREIAAAGGRLRDTDRAAEGLILEANGLLESGSPRFRPVLDRWFGLLEARNEPRDSYMVTTRRVALALLEGDTATAETSMYAAADIGERIHEPDTGNVLMSQRVALARARNDPNELVELAADAVEWWTGAPVLAHSVAAGARAAAGDLEGAALEVAMVSDAGGWQSEGSYLRSVLVAHLAEAATTIGDRELCAKLLDDITPLVDSCGVNGAVVAFAGPFAHTAGILAGALGDDAGANRMLEQSVDTAQRVGASIWVLQGKAALGGLREPNPSGVDQKLSDVDHAAITKVNKIWTVSWREEHGSLPHVKGLADIAMLLRLRGQDVSAVRLMGGIAAGGGEQVLDLQALDAYRSRLDVLSAEIEQAQADGDIGRGESLEDEREQVLGEFRRSTGLGGRARLNSNDPGERARKAVSARIRDAIGRIDAVAPLLAAHLDRSIKTGLQCHYSPAGDDASISWSVEG